MQSLSRLECFMQIFPCRKSKKSVVILAIAKVSLRCYVNKLCIARLKRSVKRQITLNSFIFVAFIERVAEKCALGFGILQQVLGRIE